MRWILHCDLDNFYASVECIRRPELRAVPMAVCGDTELRHGIVLAKNPHAKKLGIKTGMVIWEARQRCKDLICIKPNMDWYIAYSRRVRDIYYRYTDQIETFGIDEAWLDVSGSISLFGSAYEIARQIQKDVIAELGLTVSVGISFNKVFAKLGSDQNKPNGITVFEKNNYKELVWPLPVEDLLFVGRKTSEKLHSWGVHTIGDLANMRADTLNSKLGKFGKMLWVYATGQDHSPVMLKGESVPIKSVGNSTTTPRDLEGDQDIRAELFNLSESVSSRLRDYGFRGSVIEIWIRTVDMISFIRQTTIARPTCLTTVIANTAFDLFKKHYRWDRPLRSIGVRVKGLSPITDLMQFSLFAEDQWTAAHEDLEIAIDGLRKRYGYNAVLRGIHLYDETLPVISPEDARKLGAGMYDMTPQR